MFPSLIGLLNAFLVLGIVVVIIYLYKWLVVEKRLKTPAPTQASETGGELATAEKQGREVLTTQEVAAAVAAVKHHVKSALGRITGSYEAPRPASYWVLSWLSEVTQTLDYNPYLRVRTGE